MKINGIGIVNPAVLFGLVILDEIQFLLQNLLGWVICMPKNLVLGRKTITIRPFQIIDSDMDFENEIFP